MKFLLLAAAVIATPVLAQTTTTTTPDQTTTTTGTMQSGATTTTTTPMQQDQMSSGTQTTTTPVGGYQPAGPGYSGGTPGAGAQVVFQPAPSPDQAFPAPAPLARYPICKKGEFDHCMQGPGSTHSREVRGRRSGGR